MPIQGRLTRLSWNSQSPKGKRGICFLSWESFGSVSTRAMAWQPSWWEMPFLSGQPHSLDLHDSPPDAKVYFRTQPCTILIHGFKTIKTCLCIVCFSSFPLKRSNLDCSREPTWNIPKQHLTLPPKLFPLLSSAAPLFPFVETKEKIL